jgi:hypothetical protein
MSDLEVPEPDAVEQSQPVADVAGFVEPTIAPEVPGPTPSSRPWRRRSTRRPRTSADPVSLHSRL